MTEFILLVTEFPLVVAGGIFILLALEENVKNNVAHKQRHRRWETTQA